MRAWIIAILLGVAGATSAGMTSAQESASLGDAITSGKLILNLRPRYEYVDQANFSENAEGLTMRTLVGWQTGVWHGFSAKGVLNGMSVFVDDYNDTLNGKTQYPVIADPDDFDVNELYADYSGFSDTLLRAGRQSIVLDQARFVGNVQFRQVMQVFNAVTAENKSLKNTDLYAGYLWRVRTVTTRQFETSTTLLHGRYALTEHDDLIAFGYFQDQANAIANAAFQGPAPTDTSNQILGIRGSGAHPMSDAWKLLYIAEFAAQTDYAGGDSRIDADYLHAGGGAQFGPHSLRVDYEMLGSNDGRYAFQTPLGTNHLYQGWADVFLVTPAQGIRDTYVSYVGRAGEFTLQAAYHGFDADVGGLDFGDELDLGISYPLMEKLVGKIEYANYQAGDPATNKSDVTKWWFTLIFNW
ncbi:MAG: alginate export family protein [Burkholderiales bacterium]|jgi:hypothetical protein